jgi:hypothetical protein
MGDVGWCGKRALPGGETPFLCGFLRADDLSRSPGAKDVQDEVSAVATRENDGARGLVLLSEVGKFCEGPVLFGGDVAQREIIRAGTRDFLPALEQHCQLRNAPVGLGQAERETLKLELEALEKIEI